MIKRIIKIIVCLLLITLIFCINDIKYATVIEIDDYTYVLAENKSVTVTTSKDNPIEEFSQTINNKNCTFKRAFCEEIGKPSKWTEEEALKFVRKKIDDNGYNYTKGDNKKETKWTNVPGRNEAFPGYMFMTSGWNSVVLQWRYNNTVYLAKAFNTYDGFKWADTKLAIYTSDELNKIVANKQGAQDVKDKIDKQKGKAAPGNNISSNYTEAAYWVLADSWYNQSKELKKLAMTDDGVNKLKAWVNEWNRHIRGGKPAFLSSTSTDEEIASLTNVLYTAREVSNKLISANKDKNKVDNILNDFNEANDKIQSRIVAMIYTAAGEERNKTVFTDDVLKDISKYDPSQDPMDNNSSNRIETATSKILTVISNVGMAVAVIMLAILGIKYMLGSVEEKAEYKEGLIPYVIGAFILFGITSFVKILMVIGNQIGNLS